MQIGLCRHLELLRCGVQPLEEEEAADVVCDIGQPDRRGGPVDTYCPDEQIHLRFLIDKDMLDAGADHRLPRVGALNMAAHRLEMRLVPAELRDETLFVNEGLIGFRAIRGAGLDA